MMTTVTCTNKYCAMKITLRSICERCRKVSKNHSRFKIRRWCRRNSDLGNNHGSDRIQCHSHDRGNCGCYRRDGYFWIKHEYLEANYDRDESRRGTQGRVDQQNGSSGGRRRQDRKLTHVRSSSFRTEADALRATKPCFFFAPRTRSWIRNKVVIGVESSSLDRIHQLVQGSAHAAAPSLAMMLPIGAGRLLMETPFGRNSILSA